METENKELDLFDLLGKAFAVCKNGINTVGNGILWLVRFKLKNWIVLSVFLMAGIAFAYYSYLPKNRKFNAEFRLQVNGTNSFAVYDIIKALGQTIDVDSGNKSFAKTIGLKRDIVLPLRTIEPFYIIDLNNNKTPDYVDYGNSFKEDTLNSRMSNFLQIVITAKGKTNYNAIQKGIIDYLRKDPYLKREEVERINSLKQDIITLDTEIAALDSMRQEEFKNNKFAMSFDKTSLIIQKPTYHTDIIDLKKRRLNLQENLDVQREVVTVYSQVFVNPVRTDNYIFITRIVAVYFLGFILVLLIAYRKKIKEVLKP